MSECELCGAPKAVKTCGECERNVCKNCVRYLANDHLRFHPEPPSWAKHGVFCADCFDTLVTPEVAKYDEVMERSEHVKVIHDTFHGYIPCFKKAKRSTEVTSEDLGRGIAIQRLKFLAAWEGYDSVIELSTTGTKVRNHGWETKSWNASGVFANVDYKKFRPPE
ncbi:MAG: hypothetical protein ACXVB9_14690 [Bdellovibrionota bacterium]